MKGLEGTSVGTLDHTEQLVIETVARSGGRVEDIRGAHHKSLLELLPYEPAGGDAEELFEEVNRRADAREEALGGQNRVGVLEPRVMAQQNDTDRSITYAVPTAHSGTSRNTQVAARKHEERHKKQEVEQEAESVPATGDETFDKLLRVDRRAYREADAVRHGEGMDQTSPEYLHDYVEPVAEARGVLDRAGFNGQAMVEAAALRHQGFLEVRAALWRIFLTHSSSPRGAGLQGRKPTEGPCGTRFSLMPQKPLHGFPPPSSQGGCRRVNQDIQRQLLRGSRR